MLKWVTILTNTFHPNKISGTFIAKEKKQKLETTNHGSPKLITDRFYIIHHYGVQETTCCNAGVMIFYMRCPPFLFVVQKQINQ